jgi:hypothetical protein
MDQPNPTGTGTKDRVFTFVRIVHVHFPTTATDPAPFPLAELTEDFARETLQDTLTRLADLTDQSTWALAADATIDYDTF